MGGAPTFTPTIEDVYRALEEIDEEVRNVRHVLAVIRDGDTREDDHARRPD